MIYGSVCSGLEAASVAWHPLGWRARWFAEIAPFPSAVLAHHWPEVPNLGDFTTIGPQYGNVDILVGGTPCQSFSVAGTGRAGLDDPRGILALEFLRLARRNGARWVVWENVPGALWSHRGRDARDVLRAFVDAGYGIAWRVLDAQWLRVPQRRRRLFVVGYLGDWRPAVAVLFERPYDRGVSRESLDEGTQPPDGSQGATRGLLCYDEVQLTHPENRTRPLAGGPAPTLPATSSGRVTIVGPDMPPRRLTPREWERLQGFPDDYTLIHGAKDGPRYEALGNSMPVPVMRWIGERIAFVDSVVDFG